MPRRRLRDLSIVQNTPNSKETNSEQQTAIGSSTVPETPNEPAENHSNLKVVRCAEVEECVKVSRNNLGQPIGSEARLLARYLGIIVRNANMLLINYESWHQMPDSNKNQALDNIKERFALEVSDTYIKKNREQVGTSSRQKQKFTHTTGSKSFACVAEAELFDITHRKKDGSPMTSEAGEIMDKLKDKKVEYEAIALSDSSVNLEDIDNRIITEVLGPKSSQQYMPSGSQDQAEVQRLRNQMA
ncbi:hypothetical protein GOBAR_AA06426 [Gossypium barbadense]|uniref:Uncharacterized protein n=1 Tax=Gossypium barbadense TaxID=3634 RepID=A0A2P5YF15_GOSBA|nr:hypothetical protein GOBAR_AA06426 [Gossypium barbadense]